MNKSFVLVKPAAQKPTQLHDSVQKKEPTMEDLLNSIQLSSFNVLRELGNGGFGTVSLVRFKDQELANKTNMPSTLALKKIVLGRNVSSTQKQIVMKEAQFLKQI